MENQKYKLSKDAIKHLDEIKIENKTQMSIKSIIIKSNFIFQIEKIDKIKKGIYSSTLIDNDFKSDKFILNFEKEEEVPNKGDIIKIGQIEKSYNEEDKIYIYECKNINIISKELNIIVDKSKKDNYDNKNNKINNNNNNKIVEKQQKEQNKINSGNIVNNKNDNYEESETDEEEEEEEDDSQDDDNINHKNNINIKNENNNINNYEIINEENYKNYNKNNINMNQNEINIKEENEANSKSNQEKNHNFLLISDLNPNIQNFQIYIKCIQKDKIKEFRYKKDKKYQTYIFTDINDNKIEGISFNEVSEKLDKIIKINEIYEVNNCNLLLNKINYGMIYCPYSLLFNENLEIINISYKDNIKNKFKNKNEIINNNFISISNIITKKPFDIVSIFGFVLKDYGNIKNYDKYNREYYGRSLLLGDDSNYKVNVMIWHPNDLKEIYNEGELLYIQNVIIKEYKNKRSLYGTKYRKINNSYNSEYDARLKKYYSQHNNNEEYLEVKINNGLNNDNNNNIYGFNNVTYVKLIFIKDIPNILSSLNDKNDKEIRFKISAVVKRINHSNKNYYYGCNNCRKKMLSDICENCGNKIKTIILHYSILVVDCSSSLWLLLFGEIAENFLGIKGEEYKNILEKGISNQNIELNLLNEKVKNKEYIFMGKSQYYSYNKYNGYRFHVKYFVKKSKKQYYSLTHYLKYLLK